MQGMQQDTDPGHLRFPPGGHLLQGSPQGTLHAQGRYKGLGGRDHQEEEEH